jgi:hypothetical protein
MLRKKYLFLALTLPLMKASFGFESQYAELAYILGNNAQVIDSIIAQQAIEFQKLFSQGNTSAVEVYGDVNYAYENGKRYHSNDGIALVGLDFIYNNFIFKRPCIAGIFGGVAKDFIHYRCDGLEKGNLRMGFGGYCSNFKIFGLNISSVSLLGFAKSNTDCPQFSVAGTNFDHFTHGHRIIHSRIDIDHMWEIGEWKMGPDIGFRSDQLKQNSAREWSQNALRFKTFDGIGGIKMTKDYEKFYINSFIGVERNLHKRWSGGEIKINGTRENFTLAESDKTKFFISMGVHFKYAETWSLDLNISGHYGPRNKNSTLGLTLLKTF